MNATLDSRDFVEAGTATEGVACNGFEKMPPGGRDFDVFRRVIVEGALTRLAATEFKVSQTRVCQLLGRVRDWLREMNLESVDGPTSDRDLALARQLAADRLDHLYGQALFGWHSSDGETKRMRTDAQGHTVTTETISHGDPKYLAAATRIALAGSKLGVSQGVLTAAQAKAGDRADELGPPEANAAEADAVPEHSVDTESNHPDGACSEISPEEWIRARFESQLAIAKASRSDTYSELDPRERAARRAFFAPVQAASRNELVENVMNAKSSG